jgi:heme exporter protein A
MLTIDNINYSKNQQKLFSSLGFTIGLGSSLVIKGENGSGKTSLLRIIAGLNNLENTGCSGEILWNNENINNIKQDFYSDVQYLGHKNFLKQDLTIIDNLNFFASLTDSKILIPSAIRYFNLDNITHKKINQLSMGMQKRVLLAKLLCCPATIWLLDEPSSNLDEKGKELLFNLISTRIKEQGIVIIASHDDLFDKISGTLNLQDFKN